MYLVKDWGPMRLIKEFPQKSWKKLDWRQTAEEAMGNRDDVPEKSEWTAKICSQWRGRISCWRAGSESGSSTKDSPFCASDFQRIWHSAVVHVPHNSCRRRTEMSLATTRARAYRRESACLTSPRKRLLEMYPDVKVDFIWFTDEKIFNGGDPEESAKMTACTLQQPCRKGESPPNVCSLHKSH